MGKKKTRGKTTKEEKTEWKKREDRWESGGMKQWKQQKYKKK